MPQTQGLLTAATVLGLQSLLIKPTRMIGDLIAQVTVEEVHEDTLEMTDQPVDVGAVITDHSYMQPASLIIQCGWSNSPSNPGVGGGLLSALTGTAAGVSAILGGAGLSQVNAMYQQLQNLQRSRIPFDVYTGKRFYQNMLIKSLKVTTDKETENSLHVTATFRQVILVSVTTINVTAPASAQTNPEITVPPIAAGTKSLVPAPAYAGRGFINPPLVTP